VRVTGRTTKDTQTQHQPTDAANTKFVLQQIWFQADNEEVRVCVCQTAQIIAIDKRFVSFSLVYAQRAIGFLAGAKIMLHTVCFNINSHTTNQKRDRAV